MQVVEVTRTFAGFELGSWRLIEIPSLFEPSLKALLQLLIRFVAIVRYVYYSFSYSLISFFSCFEFSHF